MQTGDGHYLVLTAGIEKLVASYLDRHGVKLNQQTFVSRRRRKLRNRRLRRRLGQYVAAWHEINDTDPRNVTITQHGRVVTVHDIS